MRSLLAPRMLALHALVLVVVVVLVSLGSWQLRRHAEAGARAAAVEERLARDPVAIGELLDGLTLEDDEALAGLEYRPVTATGTWLPEDEVLQRGRPYPGGRSGLGVLTPLRLADGTTVLARRGAVPFDVDLRPPVGRATPPDGLVEVTGTLERSVPQPAGGAFSQRDPDEGRLEVVFNADLDRLSTQLPSPLRPMLLRVDETTAPASPVLVRAPGPEPDLGPHMSYAVQWFSFALIAAGMYALWLRRRLAGDERAVSPSAGPR